MSHPRSVAVVTLGCTRNEVDSEELAGRLAAEGWTLVADAAEADVAVVNTCGFVEQAKKDSVDALLEASDLKRTGRTQKVVAVGCMAERYGAQLAEELPEADAVLGFDTYSDMSSHLQRILAGERPASHAPRDRRRLLPVSPVARHTASTAVALPGHQQATPAPAATSDTPTEFSSDTEPATPLEQVTPATGPRVVRARLDGRPWAPLKLASGCDRRCAFCAIPMFRGAFVSRPPQDVLTEAQWLAERGVKEVFLVSENTTSYGKDLGDLRLVDGLIAELAALEGIARVRVSYLQPAEIRPDLLDAMASTPGVAPYFDISFQHASGPLLRRMRRFGDRESFLALLEQVRARVPEAGIRTNVIVGFPGESEEDLTELTAFLEEARLDVVGVFGYSDEDGTEAESYDDKIDEATILERVARVSALVEELTAQRAEDRIGTLVEVLVEDVDEDDGRLVGRAGQQGPDVDGVTYLEDEQGGMPTLAVGSLVTARVVATEGVDLVAVPLAQAGQGRPGGGQGASEPVGPPPAAGEPAA
ncbi:30S ribosomal protein S12 methylthiotransferase RimO [Ornithinimicrobium pratense]|uniref:Ribosomal protein uS12 methylthiotransferase RimO n=1 Tax=Ornithinimicrobium pratense TaxID=2593973 RepID=A0A5J6V5P7_9MICO|nr:30S ribosomal protein S12 methylthiotransferase RimO [Ornithinimicrobium pratense]QFG69088.1 30S ribosomal protein S12 methylthiotransferase RimO [Ornithinimicrobium pratense]